MVDQSRTPTRRKYLAPAITGGLGAAAAIALLSLRGSTSRKKESPPMPERAHQPDGADSSASFAASIADENTVPGGHTAPTETVPVSESAHQPDGMDSSASFQAGIADESTRPN